VGSVCARLRFCEPVPHDLVHVDQAPKPSVTQSVAHAAVLHARVSAECGHATPPSVGSTVARLRHCEPVPHDLVHVAQASKAGTTQSVAHAWVLQFCDVVAEPAQSAPQPCAEHAPAAAPAALNGAGLSHARVMDCVPVPQLLEQVPYV